jgi:hypothetical protein
MGMKQAIAERRAKIMIWRERRLCNTRVVHQMVADLMIAINPRLIRQALADMPEGIDSRMRLPHAFFAEGTHLTCFQLWVISIAPAFSRQQVDELNDRTAAQDQQDTVDCLSVIASLFGYDSPHKTSLLFTIVEDLETIPRQWLRASLLTLVPFAARAFLILDNLSQDPMFGQNTAIGLMQLHCFLRKRRYWNSHIGAQYSAIRRDLLQRIPYSLLHAVYNRFVHDQPEDELHELDKLETYLVLLPDIYTLRGHDVIDQDFLGAVFSGFLRLPAATLDTINRAHEQRETLYWAPLRPLLRVPSSGLPELVPIILSFLAISPVPLSPLLVQTCYFKPI